ncbi:unnamed protein product [Adineta steineri]|uniref:Uncharacterized protein n=1 Tax=Adineta steineri TaxID=433720 RepID=A0A814VKI5_9BILA|nr:unnamed protein product [Adineta steineri]CAF3849613.1 unnamed protein product [Adineta steineri]
MSHECAAPKCNRVFRGLCDCCQQNLCLQHLNEHNSALISQLNPLTDEINALGDRLKTIDIEEIIGDCRRKLEQWRDYCHEEIEEIFERKCHEFDQLVNEKVSQQRERLNRLQVKMMEFIRAQEITCQDIDSLTTHIRALEKSLKNIEDTCFMIHTRPLLLNDHIIFIKKTHKHELDLTSLSLVCKTIDRPDGSFASLASNDRYLLIHQHPNLTILDREMKIVKQILWTNDAIYDMCWSSTLKKFIVIGGKIIFLIDENTMAIDNMKIPKDRYWQSCTCSETSLFLSTNEYTSSIVEFRLLPSIKLIKEWKYPLTCAQDEVISGTVYNDEKLALMIMSEAEKSLRIELRNVKTLDRIWSLRLDIVCTQSIAFRCCSLTCDQWLVSDYETRRLLHITENGKVKKAITYNAIPYRANLFGHMLAISRNDGVNLHKL